MYQCNNVKLRNPINASVPSYTPDEHGGWLMDPAPRDPEDFHKIWTTSGSAEVGERRTLYEFADEDKYRKGGIYPKYIVREPGH